MNSLNIATDEITYDMTKIKDMKVGERYVKRPMLLLNVESAVAKTGSTYLKLSLRDEEREIKVNLFNTDLSKLNDEMNIVAGDLVLATISVSTYNATTSYKLETLSKCDDPSIDISAFAKTVATGTEEMFDRIIKALNTYRTKDEGSLADIAINLLKKHKDEFIRSSAAKAVHHSGIAGLIYHTFRMVMQAHYTCKVYKDLNAELLITATAIHDIAKIYEMDTSILGDATYTKKGRLLGHLQLGIDMISEEAAKGEYDEEEVMLLEHCIAAHHGSPQLNAIVSPAIPEAFALYCIDMLDSRMYIFEDEYKNMEEGTLSNKIFGLDNATIYKPV